MENTYQSPYPQCTAPVSHLVAVPSVAPDTPQQRERIAADGATCHRAREAVVPVSQQTEALLLVCAVVWGNSADLARCAIR